MFGKKHVKLPEKYEQKHLGDMQEGDETWTVPWAMKVDEAGMCWILSSSPWYAHDQIPGGTVCMHVKRVKEGFECNIDHLYGYGPHRWEKENLAEYKGFPIPVVKLSV